MVSSSSLNRFPGFYHSRLLHKEDYINYSYIKYTSSITCDIVLSAIVSFPPKPSPLLVHLHGWHESITIPPKDQYKRSNDFVVVNVDMRGRNYSSGKPDCNMMELWDIVDAVKIVIAEYRHSITDVDNLLIQGISGGGGNLLSVVSKFIGLFSAGVAFFPIVDYYNLYCNDNNNVFRDEIILWIDNYDDINEYTNRSPHMYIDNSITQLLIVAGANDKRVPIEHSRLILKKRLTNVSYIEYAMMGGDHHWENSCGLKDKTLELTGEFLKYSAQVRCPRKGQLIVPGYVSTEYFTIFLKNTKTQAMLTYDIDLDLFRIEEEGWLIYSSGKMIHIVP